MLISKNDIERKETHYEQEKDMRDTYGGAYNGNDDAAVNICRE
jgi:hypothetical protein